MKDMGWRPIHTSSMIENSKDQGVIKEITFGGRPALRKNNESAIFRDRECSPSTQTTDTDMYGEFMKFINSTSSEIANPYASKQSKNVSMNTNNSRVLLISCLQDHIASLEKQLEEKQAVIEENTRIIVILNSIQNKGNGEPEGSHYNQLLQSQSLMQVHNIEVMPTTTDITSEPKSQQCTKKCEKEKIQIIRNIKQKMEHNPQQ